MGTNYYLHVGECETCGRPKDVIHIGKSSIGWTFSFHGTDKIRSCQDWLEFIQDSGGIIKNEYDQKVPLEEFQELVKTKKLSNLNQTTYCRVHHPIHAENSCWLDDEGHSFSSGDFS